MLKQNVAARNPSSLSHLKLVIKEILMKLHKNILKSCVFHAGTYPSFIKKQRLTDQILSCHKVFLGNSYVFLHFE